MFLPDVIGMLAACLTTAAFFPQALKTIRERDTRSISLGMYSMFCAGVACWLAYGLMIDSKPVIYANVLTLAQALIILGMKLRYG